MTRGDAALVVQPGIEPLGFLVAALRLRDILADPGGIAQPEKRDGHDPGPAQLPADVERLLMVGAGQVVVTQLCCLAQPLLRYRLGDLAARIPGRCACGRGLARLSPVQGRTRHVIRLPDGRVLYGMMVSTVVKPFPEVRRWQLRQTAPDALRLLVVPSPAWTPEVAEKIARQLEEKFGRGLRFEVEPVDDIPLAPTGKLQTIVPLAETAGTATS